MLSRLWRLRMVDFFVSGLREIIVFICLLWVIKERINKKNVALNIKKSFCVQIRVIFRLVETNIQIQK